MHSFDVEKWKKIKRFQVNPFDKCETVAWLDRWANGFWLCAHNHAMLFMQLKSWNLSLVDGNVEIKRSFWGVFLPV